MRQIKMTLDTKVQEELKTVLIRLNDAKKYAKKGDTRTMENCLYIVQEYASKLKQDIPKQVAEIEKTGYSKAVLINLNDAKKYAKKGDTRTMGSCLYLVQEYASKINKDVSKEVAEIKALVKK